MPGKVGFIGVGHMGGPMAVNLVKKDFAVVVYDADPDKIAPFEAEGATRAGSPAEVASQVDRTISMVATTEQAESVIAGADGIMQGAGAGHVVISSSTIDPFAAQRLHDQLGAQGMAMLDAPVSGGTARSASGELSIMVGGDPEVFESCRDVFEAMGTNIFYIGPVGQGLAMKLVNNMLVQTHLVSICEALVMGVKAGLDPQRIYDVVRVSTGNSFGFETRVPRILDRDFKPGGSVDISYKDQELETAFAKQLGVPILTANITQQVFQMARAAGLGAEDHGALIKVLEKMAGVEVRRS